MNEHQPRRPSNYGEAMSWQARTIAAHLHDFFTFGTPNVLSELECYLHETGSDLRLADVLDVLEATARTGEHAPSPEAA
jgi:hypothetical protein